MADGQLQEPQIVRLGAKIHVDTIEDIARTKFKLDDAAIANIISENQGNVKKQSQEMIRAWKYRQGTCVNQVELLAKILYEAADEGFKVDRSCVLDVLKIREDDVAHVTTGTAPAPHAPSTTAAVQPAPSTAANSVQQAPSASGRIKLTSKMADNLAQEITSNRDLRDLGTQGFGFKQHVLDTVLSDKKDYINEAAIAIIKKWSDNYEDQAQAYSALCEILRKIGKASWISALDE